MILFFIFLDLAFRELADSFFGLEMFEYLITFKSGLKEQRWIDWSSVRLSLPR